MSRCLLILFALVALLDRCVAETTTEWIVALKSRDTEVRRRAIDQIQTSDDARIPEACLPLLLDEGISIRRQACRAIGSRFYQVPANRIQTFVKALRKCAGNGPEDVTLIAGRAIGLLTRKTASPAFSRSPDGRWVLYEQRRLPVIADSRLHRRQLLSLIHPDEEMIAHDSIVNHNDLVDIDRPTKLLKLVVTNESIEDLFRPRWHPDGAALALSPTIARRFYTPIAIWRASDGEVRTWSAKSFAKFYRKPFPEPFPHWGTTTDFLKWRGRKALIKVYDADGAGEVYDAKGIVVSVNIDTWKIALENSFPGIPFKHDNDVRPAR